jgi:hypothetical protein
MTGGRAARKGFIGVGVGAELIRLFGRPHCRIKYVPAVFKR